MALWVPPANEFSWRLCSVAGTRPAGGLGATLTPGNNTKGAYAQVLAAASVVYDIWFVHININSGATSGAARDILIDIGVDNAGGTAYQVLIPNLLGSSASTLLLGGGINYYFPIRIKAGSSIAARASVNNATVGTVRVYMRVLGNPVDPTRVKAGTYVDAVGITAASSSGTAVTTGTTSEGAWTSLVSSTTRDAWWWQLGMGVNDATITNRLMYFGDLGVGTSGNQVPIIRDQVWTAYNATEQFLTPGRQVCCNVFVPAGTQVWGRLQASTGTANSNLSLAGYYVGG